MPYGDFAPVAALTVVTASLASSVVLQANPNRQGMFLYNGSTVPVYFKFGTAVTSGSMTGVLAASGSYEDDRVCPYTGNVSVVWSGAGVGSLFITELS